MAKKRINKQYVKAEQMYHQETPLAQIARNLGVGRRTIYRWAKMGTWQEKKEQIAKDLRAEMHIDIKKEKKRTIDILHAIESRYADELREGAGVPDSTNAFVQSQKLKWDIIVPKTSIQQNNFIKNEQNNTGIEIIMPKGVKELLDGEVSPNS